MDSPAPEQARSPLKAVAMTIGWIVVFLACARLLLIVGLNRTDLQDFVQEWTSARNFLTGEPIYQSLDESLPRYFPGFRIHGIKYNAHPPFSVLLCVPLGFLDYHIAFLTWTVGSFALLVIAIRLIAGQQGLAFDALTTCGAALLIVTSNAFEQQIFQGQWNCVLLTLIVGAWRLVRHDRIVSSGILIGIAGALKLVPIFLMIYFATQRQWRAVFAAILTFTLLNALTALVFGVETYLTYFGSVTAEVAKFRDTWPNASILGYWSKLFDGVYGHVQPLITLPIVARALTLACAAPLILGLTITNLRSTTAGQRDIAFALTIITMLLVSPITWDHYFVMLALPLAILWKSAQSATFRSALVFIGLTLISLRPNTFWRWTVEGYSQLGETAALAPPWITASVIAYQTYLLLVFYLFTCLIASRTQRMSIVSEPSFTGTAEKQI